MVTRSKIFQDRSQSPVDEAVFWTEFVLRQDDTSALKPMLLDQPWYVRTSLDVYTVYVFVAIIPPLLLAYFIVKVFKCFY